MGREDPPRAALGRRAHDLLATTLPRAPHPLRQEPHQLQGTHPTRLRTAVVPPTPPPTPGSVKEFSDGFLGELGAEYQFVYRAASACKGAGELKTPATPGMSLGEEHEVLPAEPVSALKPKTEYAVCLLVTNLAKTETVASAAFIFKTATAAKPEPPEATPVSERRATAVTLNGVVNPLKEGEPGHYRFLYAQSASVCTGGSETAEEPAPGSFPQPVSAAITGLEAGKPYTFCVKAFNALGEATLSAPRTFTTAVPPQA